MAEPNIRARRKLIRRIFAANGHHPDAETLPTCGVVDGVSLYLAIVDRDEPDSWHAGLHVYDAQAGRQLNNGG